MTFRLSLANTILQAASREFLPAQRRQELHLETRDPLRCRDRNLRRSRLQKPGDTARDLQFRTDQWPRGENKLMALEQNGNGSYMLANRGYVLPCPKGYVFKIFGRIRV